MSSSLNHARKEQRPVIRPLPQRADFFLEIVGWIAVTALVLVAIRAYAVLPEIIPVHFGVDGNPDRFGSKSAILILPVVGSLLFIAMTALQSVPHKFNYPVTITEHNAARQYRLSLRLFRVLKLYVALECLLIVLVSAGIARQQIHEPGLWMMASLFPIFIVIGWYLFLAFRHR